MKKPIKKNQHRPISRSLPIALLRTREHVMVPIRPLLAEIGMTEQKWRILRVLADLGALEQTSIARESCLLLPSLTRILRSMEADDLVIRSQDTGDGRRTIVDITDKGRALIMSYQPRAFEIFQRLESQFGKEKLETLLDLLEEVLELKL